MNKKTLHDILFLIGVVVVIWIGLKILLWTITNLFLLVVILLIIYFLYRMGIFKKIFR